MVDFDPIFFQWSKKKMMEFCKQCCKLAKFIETKEYSGTHLNQQKSNYLYYLPIVKFFINSENLFLSISWQLCCINNYTVKKTLFFICINENQCFTCTLAIFCKNCLKNLYFFKNIICDRNYNWSFVTKSYFNFWTTNIFVFYSKQNILVVLLD